MIRIDVTMLRIRRGGSHKVGSPLTTRCGQAFSLDAQCHFSFIHPAQKRVLIILQPPFPLNALSPLIHASARLGCGPRGFAHCKLRRQCRFSLFPSHEFLDFVVVADKEKDNLIGELKKDTIFESCADFPIVAMPVFQAKAGGQPSFAIQVVHEGVNGFIYFLLPSDG